MASVLDEHLRAELLSRHPLPAIRSPSLLAAVRARPTRSSRISTRPHNDQHAHFEVLESLGDTVVAAAIGRSVYRHLTLHGGGSAAIFAAYRSLLQSNHIFAQLAIIYNLHVHLTPPMPPNFDPHDVNDASRKTLGDAFEAYVGGLDVDDQVRTAEDWLQAIFARLCGWAEDRVVGSNVPQHKVLVKDYLGRFARALDAPTQDTAACACWKHALSACVKRLGLRYEFKTEQIYSVELAISNGESFQTTSSTKKAAENEGARQALLALEPATAASIGHACDLRESSESGASRPTKRAASSETAYIRNCKRQTASPSESQ